MSEYLLLMKHYFAGDMSIATTSTRSMSARIAFQDFRISLQQSLLKIKSSSLELESGLGESCRCSSSYGLIALEGKE